ncbi:MAG: dihydroorotase [Acidobacteriota bacterium]
MSGRTKWSPGSLLVRGGRLIDPEQDLDGSYDVLIEDGLVAEVGEGVTVAADVPVFEAEGRVVTPGLLDIHVHLREPGQEYKEDIESGTRAAVAGGFTALACMANTDPANDTPSVTEHILKQAERFGHCRVYPVGAVSKGLAGDELAEIGEMHKAGIVAISDDGHPIENPELMRRALMYAQQFDRPLVQHAQDLLLSGKGVMHEGEYSTRLGIAGIPGAAEDAMVARDILLVEDVGGRYHVQHLSTARSLELVRQAKARGLTVTCEVTPHHLLLSDRTVFESGLDPNTKMNPPLRSEDDRQALIAGLQDGTIDLIASDHAPHHPDEKELDFVDAPFGILGLETTLPLCLDRLVGGGVVTLERLVALLTCEPARIMGLPGGTLAVGSPGDVTVIDTEREVVVDPNGGQSRSCNTPFAGWQLKGAAVATVVAGQVAYRAES